MKNVSAITSGAELGIFPLFHRAAAPRAWTAAKPGTRGLKGRVAGGNEEGLKESWAEGRTLLRGAEGSRRRQVRRGEGCRKEGIHRSIGEQENGFRASSPHAAKQRFDL